MVRWPDSWGWAWHSRQAAPIYRACTPWGRGRRPIRGGIRQVRHPGRMRPANTSPVRRPGRMHQASISQAGCPSHMRPASIRLHSRPRHWIRRRRRAGTAVSVKQPVIPGNSVWNAVLQSRFQRPDGRAPAVRETEGSSARNAEVRGRENNYHSWFLAGNGAFS